MKTLLALTLLLAGGLALHAGSCSGCNAHKKLAPKQSVTYIDKAELLKLIKANDELVIVDVLSEASYRKAHIKGAINIPLAQINDESNLAKLRKYKTVVVYCANKRCKASTKAALALQKHGLKNVVDYENGLAEWKASKLPLGSSK